MLTSRLPVERRFKLAFNAAAGAEIVLKKAKDPIPEEQEIIDQLIEDVLPHGYAEA